MSVTVQSWTGCPAILACWHYRKEVGVTALCGACSQFDYERQGGTPRILTKWEVHALEALRYASIAMVRDDKGSVYQMSRDDQDRVCGAEIARRATKA